MNQLADYYTPAEAAPLLGIEPRMVRRWCQRNQIGQKIGGRYLIHRSEIDKFSKEHRPHQGRKPQK